MNVCVNSPMRSSGQLAGGRLPSRRKHAHSQNSHELSLSHSRTLNCTGAAWPVWTQRHVSPPSDASSVGEPWTTMGSIGSMHRSVTPNDRVSPVSKSPNSSLAAITPSACHTA